MTAKKEIIVRFGIIYAVAILIMLPILFSIGKTVVKDGDFWRAQGAKFKRDSLIVKPKRGNILDCNGKLLAGSIPSYKLYMDFKTDGLEENMLGVYADTLFSVLAPIYYQKNDDKKKSKNEEKYDEKKFSELKKKLKANILKKYYKKENEGKNVNLQLSEYDVSPEEYKKVVSLFPVVIYKDSKLFINSTVLKREALNYCMESISACLADVYKDKSKEEMKMNLQTGYKKRSRRYLLSPREVSYVELKQIKENPFFSKGSYKSGLIAEDRAKRKKPFGLLASRTIGGLYAEKDKGGSSGIEMKFDSVLRGKEGFSSIQIIAGKFRPVNEIDPADGLDIKMTIDVNIQDIAESALMKRMKEIDADRGCAVVMEVKTGEIKAISNLERAGETYTENQNFAVSSETEPGSTFKTASLMVALEDGVVDTSYRVNTEKGEWTIRKETKPMTDHNKDKGGYGEISLAQALWYSSNIGVSKTIYEFYGNKPERFVDGLYALKLNEPMNLEIPGTGRPKIKHPKDPTTQWWGTSLPWMSIGYETQIPPIYMLTFYNGIANGGKMIKPFFVKATCKDGNEMETFSTEVINPSLCSESTLGKIKQMLIDVVEKGTAKSVRSKNFRIAGKTGTAQVDYNKKGKNKTYQLTFCGYFPADNPQYSCIVVVWNPRKGYASAGDMAGVVFKNIAERIYAQSPLLQSEPQLTEKNGIQVPYTKGGKSSELKTVLDDLKISYNLADGADDGWVSTEAQEDNIRMYKQKIEDNLVPKVLGMGVKDALYLLENKGLQVKMSGKGKVYSQSIQSGRSIRKGDIIQLELR